MVHRALLGAIERFYALLVEHYAGAFPVWLSPIQAVVIPISDRHGEYAQSIKQQLQKAGIRATVDTSSDRMNAKIRDAQLQKIPYMLVVGDRELEDGTVAVRLRTEEDLGSMTVEHLLEQILPVIQEKSLELTS
jgi:threonyl-tRNA synthetase